MITREDGFVFDYDTVDKNFDKISKLEIGRTFVSPEDVETIEEMFELEKKTVEELRAIRNAVVRRIHVVEMKAANLTEDGEEIPGTKVNYDAMITWSNRMSGITAVIDKWIFKRGGMY